MLNQTKKPASLSQFLSSKQKILSYSTSWWREISIPSGTTPMQQWTTLWTHKTISSFLEVLWREDSTMSIRLRSNFLIISSSAHIMNSSPLICMDCAKLALIRIPLRTIARSSIWRSFKGRSALGYLGSKLTSLICFLTLVEFLSRFWELPNSWWVATSSSCRTSQCSSNSMPKRAKNKMMS